MSPPAIETLHAEAFGCVKDVTINLTSLHALIGPNDSGKTTLLRAIRTICQLGAESFTEINGELKPFDPKSSFREGSRLSIQHGKAVYECRMQNGAIYDSVKLEGSQTPLPGEMLSSGVPRSWNEPGLLRGLTRGKIVLSKSNISRGITIKPGGTFLCPETEISGLENAIDQQGAARLDQEARQLQQVLTVARWVQFDPSQMRKPSPLIESSTSIDFLSDNGTGLSGVLDAILGLNPEEYARIHEEFKSLFPTVAKLSLINSNGKKVVQATLKDGTKIPSESMSEGMLYYLGFLLIPHIKPTSVLLLEEPENGLHPSRIADVMRIIRKVSESSQVILATHSPLVINELAPEEVSIVTRSAESGTKVTPMTQTPHFERRKKAFALGELWLSYADGNTEAPLLEGVP